MVRRDRFECEVGEGNSLAQQQEIMHQISAAPAFVAQTTERFFEPPQAANQQSAARLRLQLLVIMTNQTHHAYDLFAFWG